MTLDPRAVPIRDAATVVLVRDGRDGLEVFMVRRTIHAVFTPGAHVFPGGAIDAGDHDPALWARCAPVRDAVELPAAIAAVRECFEEAGILLARRDGAPLELGAGDAVSAFAAQRAALHAGERTLLELCEREGLELATDVLLPFGHWTTPLGPPRRFATRFFVAPAPAGQHASHDGRETTAGMWARPEDVLDGADRGEIELILPTRRTLQAIATFPSVADVLAEGAAQRATPAEDHELS